MTTEYYTQILRKIFALRRFGMKLGLENITTLLRELGNPHENLRFIHIAGTNGKGSVAAIVDAVLRTAGLSVGLFTSPHLIWFGERIRHNGISLSPDELVDLYLEIEPALRRTEELTGVHPTFFETTTAMALVQFKRKKTNWVVWETGLGGRLDATNIVTPEISVITSIGYDHCKWLGNTLEKIAAEKAGIIKPHTPVVTIQQVPEVMDVLTQNAKQKNAPLYTVFQPTYCRSPQQTITLQLGCKTYATNFLASYQINNIALAIKVLEILKERSLLPKITQQHISSALQTVCWPARMDVLRQNPWFIVDGAHNPDGAAALVKSLQEIGWPANHATLVTASMNDKDVEAIARYLAPTASQIICTQVRSTRSVPAGDLVEIYRKHSAATVQKCCTDKLHDLLQNLYQSSLPVLVAGSLYLAGETLFALRGTAFPNDIPTPSGLKL